MTHIRKPSPCSDSCEATVDPSSLAVGDMARIAYMDSSVSVYGKVIKVDQHGAWLAPYTRQGIRVMTRKVYMMDDECVVEEVNGESLFQV